MRSTRHKGAWIFWLVATFAWFAPATNVKAEIEPGLVVTVYNNYWYNQSPPLPDVSGRPVVGTTTFAIIDQNFDANPPFGLYEDFIVKYEGYITAPITGNITFYPYADDGTKLFIDGILRDNNWRDKGGGGYPTAPIAFVEGEPRLLTYWFYENGGGAWTTLYWNIGNGLEVVPFSAFTQTSEVPATTSTTTTTSTSSTIPEPEPTTTTTQETTTTFTTVPQTVPETTVPESTTTTQSPTTLPEETTTTSSSSTTVPPTTTTTQAPSPPTGTTTTTTEVWVPPAPATTVPETTTTEEPTTTTVDVPQEETTIPEPEQTTVPEPEVTMPEVEETYPDTTVAVPTTQLLPDLIPDEPTTPEEVAQEVTAVIEELTTIDVVTDEVLNEVLDILESGDVTKEQVQEIISAVLESDITTEQATQLATSAAVIQNVTGEQAAEIFSSIDTGELTAEEAAAIVEAVQNAPDEVREAFEEEINVFGGGFDNYVPTGSSISVAARRAVVAATAVLFVAPLPVPTSSSSQSGSTRKKGK